MADSGAFGMMDGTYFVGRKDLLKWLNTTLELNYTKVEDVCTGSAFCQLMDAMFPGTIGLHKVKFDARHEYEYVHNFKLLQSAFDKSRIVKKIDIQRLVKGKYQDNLEFFQWFRRFFLEHYDSQGTYDAKAVRMKASRGREKQQQLLLRRRRGLLKENASSRRQPVLPSPPATTRINRKKSARRYTVCGMSPLQTSKAHYSVSSSTKSPSIKKSATTTTTTTITTTGCKKKLIKPDHSASLRKISEDLNNILIQLERERTRYFNQLQQIEAVCEANPSNELTAQLQTILHDNASTPATTTTTTS